MLRSVGCRAGGRGPGGRGGEALEKVNPGKCLTERNRKLCCNPIALCQWCAEPARAVKGRAQPARAVKGSNNTCNQSAESARALKGSNNTQYIHLLENLLLARPINFRGSLNLPRSWGNRAWAYKSHGTSINQTIFQKLRMGAELSPP